MPDFSAVRSRMAALSRPNITPVIVAAPLPPAPTLNQDPDQLLLPSEVAALARMNVRTVLRLPLAWRRIGRHWRLRRGDWSAWLQAGS